MTTESASVAKVCLSFHVAAIGQWDFNTDFNFLVGLFNLRDVSDLR